jgi:hypothetical protein
MTAVSRNVNRRAEIGAHMAAVFGHASAALNHTIATHRDQIERTLQRDSPALSR